MKRITIIVDEAVYDKLPIKGKSPFINVVLKNHFRKDTAEEIYRYIVKRLEKEYPQLSKKEYYEEIM